MRPILACAAALILAVAIACSAEPPPAAPAPEQPVSIMSYWRYWLTARPAVTTESFTDNKGRKRTELAIQRNPWGIGPERSTTTPDPAAGWEAADFDDSAWPVQRMPMGMGKSPSFWDEQVFFRRMAARTRFEVPDPAAVRSLKLSMVYRGGVVIYLNGREIARGHLTAGQLSPEAFAEGYPKGAYGPADNAEAAVPGAAKELCEGGKLWNRKVEWPKHGWQGGPESSALAEKVLARRQRKLESVVIDPKWLVKGPNVLAVEGRCAAISPLAHSWGSWYMDVSATFWAHLLIEDIKLVSDPPGAVRAAARPKEAQLWGDDVHRWVLNLDFLEPGVKVRPVEMVAARGGVFSGQAILGTSSELAGLKASVSDLAGPGGAKIPASAVLVRYGVANPIENVKSLNQFDHNFIYELSPIRYADHLGREMEMAAALVVGASGNGDALLPKGLTLPQTVRAIPHYFFSNAVNRTVPRLDWLKSLRYFDQLSAAAPAAVPADSCQPVWLTVSVPADAPPGDYAGKLTVSAAGMLETALPVKVAVTGFALPPTQKRSTFVAVEDDALALARKYKLAPWSPDHWQRVEEMVGWLGALGNNLVQAPLVLETTIGNQETMVVWEKKGEAYSYDWTALDRYLGLARKHFGTPLAVVALVHPPNDIKTKRISVTLKEGGERKRMPLPEIGTPEFSKVWMPFARAFVARVKEQKLADTIHWGIFYDKCPETLDLMAGEMAKELPEVTWMRSSHDGTGTKPTTVNGKWGVGINAHIRNYPEPDWAKGGVGRKGWGNPELHLLFPRVSGAVTSLMGTPPLWHLRELPELSITSSARGFARIGANYWDQGVVDWYSPPICYLLYPGKEHVEGSAQLEALREGLQECEARIALEKKAPDAAILRQRTGAAWLLPGGDPYCRIGEFYGGWQERSRALYEEAAK